MKVWNNYIFQGETVTRAYIVRVHKEGQEIMKTKKGGQWKKKKNQLSKELLWEK